MCKGNCAVGMKVLKITSAIILVCLALSSCDTPGGQGAAWGAATGAIIGGAATGHVRAASIGAAAGAAAAGWLSICALGWDARFLLQSLHGTRLRPSRSSTWWSYARRRYWPAFPQTVTDCQRSGQRTCAWSASTTARASSVIFNNSGHER